MIKVDLKCTDSRQIIVEGGLEDQCICFITMINVPDPLEV